tara:strand:- start:121 stop:909 length:789 start_codon:yes stop_codon:yes gene_type:complete
MEKRIKMIKKTIFAGALALPIMLTNPAKSFEFPQETPYGSISANVGYYSQYVWRGEQQNAGQSAVQGGLDYGVTLLDTYVDAYIGFWGSNVSGGTNSLSGNELDYYGGFTGAVPLLEDYFSWDAGILYYDYPGMTDQNTADGARNVDFVEYYGSLSLAVPNPITDIGISYYYGYSPNGFQQGEYDYHNVSMEVAIPNTPFIIAGGAGFTGTDDEGMNQYTDYIASISTSIFGLDLGVNYTTVDGYTTDTDMDQVTFSIVKSF